MRARRRPTIQPFLRYGLDAWILGLEASSVIALRTMKLAAGGLPAKSEMDLMVLEKAKAALELQFMLSTGLMGLSPWSAATKTMSHYRKKIRANKRRLTKSPSRK